MSKKKDEKKIHRTKEEMEDFNIRINKFGEIETSYDIDDINKFLNENVEDKKLRGQQGVLEEE